MSRLNQRTTTSSGAVQLVRSILHFEHHATSDRLWKFMITLVQPFANPVIDALIVARQMAMPMMVVMMAKLSLPKAGNS